MFVINSENKIFGKLVATMEINYKNIILLFIFRLFFCLLWWSVWFREDFKTIMVVVLISLPVLLTPFLHCFDKIELYEKGLLRKKKFYTWEQIGSVQFNIYKPNGYQWLKEVKMSTNCKVFNVTYLKNPMDTYSKIEQIQKITETESISCQ